MMDPRLQKAVSASRNWYDDIFAVHRIATDSDGALWWAESAAPRWHSVVKTLVPTTDPSEVLVRMERHEHGSVADAFALLDLTTYGFEPLFTATWLHHDAVATPAMPTGWDRVLDDEVMARWNHHHDTVGVLPTDLWAHPRFTVLARSEGADLTGGAILHDAESVVGLSNTWSSDGAPTDPRVLLRIAAAVSPGRAIVDYAAGADLEAMLDAGFDALGPHRIWVR